MEREYLSNPDYIRLKQEFDYLEEQYRNAKKEYKEIDAKSDIVDTELLLMRFTQSHSEEEIRRKKVELDEIRNRLFDASEKMCGFFIAKVQKSIEIQDKYTNPHSIQKKIKLKH